MSKHPMEAEAPAKGPTTVPAADTQSLPRGKSSHVRLGIEAPYEHRCLQCWGMNTYAC